MTTLRRVALSLAVAAAAVPVFASADDVPVSAGQQSPPPVEKESFPGKPSKKQLEEVKSVLELKQAEAVALSMKCSDVTKNIGNLVASGRIQSDPDATAELKRMVDELDQINEQLKKLNEDISDIKGWMEGINESLPIIQNDVDTLKKTKISGYLQSQYRWSDQIGQNRGFSIRRARLSLEHGIDSKTKLKMSFDLAGSQFGSTINESTGTAVQLKDAFLTYSPVISEVNDGISLRFGQFSTPVGYEIERSSSDREFPERAQYNLALFPGERVRGFDSYIALSDNVSAHIGLFNSLSVNDNEQRTISGPPGDRMASVVGLKYHSTQFDAGINAYLGKRAPVRVGRNGNLQTEIFAPEVDRRLVYVDFSSVGLIHENLLLRGEYMWGEDRLGVSPYTSTSAGGITDLNDARLDSDGMRGWHLQAGWNINSRNQVFLKWQGFDADTDADDNDFSGFGMSYLYFINPNARLMFSWEEFGQESSSSTTRYKILTFRTQFKF